MTPEKLSQDLSAARAAGEAAASATPDGGSMSADHVHIPVGASCPLSFRNRSYDAVVGSSGHFRPDGIWRGYLIVPAGSGQASARLASAEAMARVLRERGWDAHVYYQRD